MSGRAVLPRWLRGELARLLITPSPPGGSNRTPDTDAGELQAAVQSTITSWRVLENTGRVPFSRTQGDVDVMQALERLHAELACSRLTSTRRTGDSSSVP